MSGLVLPSVGGEARDWLTSPRAGIKHSAWGDHNIPGVGYPVLQVLSTHPPAAEPLIHTKGKQAGTQQHSATMPQNVILPGPAPWGFRLSGGIDFNQPLIITRVCALFISFLFIVFDTCCRLLPLTFLKFRDTDEAACRLASSCWL